MCAVVLNRWGPVSPLHFREVRKLCVIRGATWSCCVAPSQVFRYFGRERWPGARGHRESPALSIALFANISILSLSLFPHLCICLSLICLPLGLLPLPADLPSHPFTSPPFSLPIFGQLGLHGCHLPLQLLHPGLHLAVARL
ncbi:hypothetical protein EYF80_044522 [Liparis tanakae]|uniref:Uncharacterized protein n=1 Tax=Liparis tanakae TaxID=230148 RepID=A0A4Z2FY93_9TELE|nr:hypothetical protein EYF80_044522 [Liparis tanakae]